MDENQRKLDEYDRKHPVVRRGLADRVIDKVMDELEPLVKKMPEWSRDTIRSGIRKGLKKGSEAMCDAVVDGANAAGPDAEALKAVCKEKLLNADPTGGTRR
jgi:hypothetical protein